MENPKSGTTLVVVGTAEILTLQPSCLSPAMVPSPLDGLIFGDVSPSTAIWQF